MMPHEDIEALEATISGSQVRITIADCLIEWICLFSRAFHLAYSPHWQGGRPGTCKASRH